MEKKNQLLRWTGKDSHFPYLCGNTSLGIQHIFNKKYFDLCKEQSLGSDPYNRAVHLYRLAGLTWQVWVPLACGRMSSILDLPSQTGRVCACERVSVAKSGPTLCHPLVCSPPGSSVRGIFQARIVEWGCCFLRKEIFRTQGSNLWLLYLLHWQAVSLLYPPSPTHLVYRSLKHIPVKIDFIF